MKTLKYTIKDFQADFPDDNACLEWLKDFRFPDGIYCPNDKKMTPHHKLTNRKAYSCELCGHHTYPTAGTIFHKSSTPLTLWFYAGYLITSTRAGISAKQLERELGVTYKTAWRMFHQIRKMMADDGSLLKGGIEIDETYLTPDARKRHKNALKPKAQIVFGMVERGGRVRAKHVSKAGAALIGEIEKNVERKGSQLYSDGYMAYRELYWKMYDHQVVQHAQGEYVRREVHTQNIDNFWSNMKRGIRGVYRHVEPQHLQAYVDEYAFRYSHRNDYQPMFWSLLGKIGTPSEKSS